MVGVNVTKFKTVPGYRTHILGGTILFLFSKIERVIVFVLLSCYSVVTIRFEETSN